MIKNNKKKLSIIIPCFNEEENIKEIYFRLTKVLSEITNLYEIIFINNGSNDSSENIFRSLVNKDYHVVVIYFSRNFGPHGAYTAGLEYASGDAVICIDGDLQDPPELITQMVDKWKNGFEVVYGIRKNRKGSRLRKILTILYYRVLNMLSHIDIPLDAGDFALMDRKVVNIINVMPEHNKYFTGLRAWAGFRQTGISYDRAERKGGKTKFSLLNYLQWAVQNIFSFSYKPLQLISFLATLIVFLILFGIFIYFLDFLFYPNNPRGFITLILVILFLGGVQLLCLSIIGQYIVNIYEEVKNRPHYLINEVLKKNSLKSNEKKS
ncbi:MAG: hypothetical protein A2857_06220 [Candidatus Levybacteria bacterium RIFCSPHIGHO2_01_FULL_36_15]|nr:MAG: hypothetical protein A2857_06220 [Candidatus Levybacteria bacterium RIFCSPHIGHO2_01_FULL_36_15]